MTDKTSAPFAYEGLDRIIHEKARLSIMSSLAAHDGGGAGLVFNDLKDLCALTDGNLSRHLSILHDAKLIHIQKSFHNNRPQTTIKLTALGQKQFTHYITQLERVISTALKSSPKNRPKLSPT